MWNMRRIMERFMAVLCCPWFFAPNTSAQDTAQVKGPTEYTYRTVDGKALKAYVFQPDKPITRRAAIVLFHGGGWHIGEPQWTFGRARHFAGRGLVAVAIQYRLSDQKSITPLEAMTDARASIRWMRSNATLLGVNPNRIVAFGWSAGGHLAVSTAIFGNSTLPELSHAPNALILVSPAVYLESDRWVQRLLGKRATAASISPVANITKGLPPTLILQGSEDTVTPLKGAQLFRDRMRAAGNNCDLQVYAGVGHLFTPAGIRDDSWPQPDPKVQEQAFQKADEFLISLGFMR